LERTVVIVIDALDEGYDLETLEVLRNKIPKLPGTFRVVLTSRPLDGIVAALSGADHIQRRSIDIHSDTNRQDIALYVWDRLRYISSRRDCRQTGQVQSERLAWLLRLKAYLGG